MDICEGLLILKTKNLYFDSPIYHLGTPRTSALRGRLGTKAAVMDPESRNVSRKRLDSVTFMFEGDQAIPNVATSPAILHHNYDSGGTEEQVWSMDLNFIIQN